MENEQIKKELTDLKIEVLTQLAVINSKLDGYPEVKKISTDADTRSRKNEQDIKDLQDKEKWILRTVIGAILTAVVSLLFLFAKIGMGVE